MAIDPAAPSSRRALLAASLGGGLALVANALGRPLPADAANGATVTVGNNGLTGTTVTRITTTGDAAIWGASPDNYGLVGTSSISTGVIGESGGNGNGVYGFSSGGTGVRGEAGGIGVHGMSSVNPGVLGTSTSNTGVKGESTGNTGVWGTSSNAVGVTGTGKTGGVNGSSAEGPGVKGHSNAVGGAGVLGTSILGSSGVVGFIGTPPVSNPANTGVFGYSTVDAASRGVIGQSTSGQGVRGVATTGRGVHGEAVGGIGVRAYATSGTGLLAEATTGTALRAVGRVRFDDCAGVATIASGTKSVTVTPGIDLVATSAVVATLMGSAGGTTNVHRVSVNVTTNTFAIYLTANSTAAVKVAWHVFG